MDDKSFWEALGFVFYVATGNWRYPDGLRSPNLPDFTLDNLFKYAVPKFQPEVIKLVPVTGVIDTEDYGLKWGCSLLLKGWSRSVSAISDSPALALKEAISKVLEAKDERD